MSAARVRGLLHDAERVRDQLLDEAQRDGTLNSPVFATVMGVVGDEIDGYRRMLADS